MVTIKSLGRTDQPRKIYSPVECRMQIIQITIFFHFQATIYVELKKKRFKTIEPQKSIINKYSSLLENKSYLHSSMFLCLYIAGTKFPLANSPFWNFETIQSEVSRNRAKVTLPWAPLKMHLIIKPAESFW